VYQTEADFSSGRNDRQADGHEKRQGSTNRNPRRPLERGVAFGLLDDQEATGALVKKMVSGGSCFATIAALIDRYARAFNKGRANEDFGIQTKRGRAEARPRVANDDYCLAR
jgi:hypothetical protein